MRSRIATIVATTPIILLVACGAEDGDGGSGSENGAWAPSGTSDLIVGGGPGGGSDILARTFLSSLEETTDISVTVSNLQPIEAELDVYSDTGNAEKLGVGNWANMIVDPLETDTDYSSQDFSQLAIVAGDIMYLVSGTDRFENAEEMLAEASETELTVAQVGGSGGHSVIVNELAEELDVQFRTVGYDGGGDQMNAVVAGDVDLAILAPGAFMPFVESGDAEVILNTGTEENTPEELEHVSYASDFGAEQEYPVFWRNFYAPPGLEPEQIDFWVEALESWTATAEYDQYIEDNYLSPMFVTADALDQLMADDEEFVREALDE